MLAHTRISRRQLVAAFAGCDVLGSLLGGLLFPFGHFVPMPFAFVFAWMAYSAAIALLLIPKALRNRCVYFVPLVLCLDNVLQGMSGGPSSVSFTAVSAVVSGMFAIIGCSIGTLAKTKLARRDWPAHTTAVGALHVKERSND
jgi:hypothetical protein